MLALLGTLCERGPRQYRISWDLLWKSEFHRLMLRSSRVRLLVSSNRSSAVSRCAVELSPKGTMVREIERRPSRGVYPPYATLRPSNKADTTQQSAKQNCRVSLVPVIPRIVRSIDPHVVRVDSWRQTAWIPQYSLRMRKSQKNTALKSLLEDGRYRCLRDSGSASNDMRRDRGPWDGGIGRRK